jgi:hypothetical protein
MILGALAVGTAVATERENTSTNDSLMRECNRYGLAYSRVLTAYSGSVAEQRNERRRWWDYAILATGAGMFVYLGVNARVPALEMNFGWLAALAVVLVVSAALCAWALGKATRFS